MIIDLNRWQSALLLAGWTLTINRGLFKIHYAWEGRSGGKAYQYSEDDVAAEVICKRHRILNKVNSQRKK